MGQVIGLVREPLAGLERPKLSLGERCDRTLEVAPDVPLRDDAWVAPQGGGADIDDGVGEGPGGGLAGGKVTGQQRAAKVGLRRGTEPLGDVDAPCLAGGVEPDDRLQRRGDQIGQRAADAHFGHRRQVTAHRGDDVRIERHRRRRSGQGHAVEPGVVLQVGQAGGQRRLDLGGIAGGVDADALSRQGPRWVGGAGVERPGVDDVGRRGLGPLVERGEERIVGGGGDDAQRAAIGRKLEHPCQIGGRIGDGPHGERARLERRKIELHGRAPRFMTSGTLTWASSMRWRAAEVVGAPPGGGPRERVAFVLAISGGAV